MKIIAATIVALFLFTACGGESDSDKWYDAVESAGWSVGADAFDKAEYICDMSNKERVELLSMALADSESLENMQEKEIDPGDAVWVYIDATREFRC